MKASPAVIVIALTYLLAFPSAPGLALDSQLCRKPHSRREIPSQSQLPVVYVFRARQVAGRDIKIVQKRASRARARVYPRVFVSTAVHAARIIPGEFLRGLPCGAFESVHARASPPRPGSFCSCLAGNTTRVIKVDGAYSPR